MLRFLDSTSLGHLDGEAVEVVVGQRRVFVACNAHHRPESVQIAEGTTVVAIHAAHDSNHHLSCGCRG